MQCRIFEMLIVTQQQLLQCRVVKLADTPPCLGGGENGIKGLFH